jgi:hypothetical protein
MRTRKVQNAATERIAEDFRFPVWFGARPGGKTPLCAALGKAKLYMEGFVASQSTEQLIIRGTLPTAGRDA